MPTTIVINEICPNPVSGSEWIELKINKPSEQEISLRDYTIFDSYHQIYKFDAEQFSNQLLVVEVNGLNNDQDSVILKDKNSNVLDSFSYTQTQKGLSFAREIDKNTFVLGPTSRNQINSTLIIAPTNLENEPTATPSPILSQAPLSPSPLPTPSSSATLSVEPTPTIKKDNQSVELSLATTLAHYHSYDLSKIKLKAEEKYFQARNTRLVLLGQNFQQTTILNAIIGSLLIILSSLLLIYVKIKNKHS